MSRPTDKAITEKVPGIEAYLTASRSQLIVHCPFCGAFHYHAPEPGSCSSHCARNQGTYTLKMGGVLSVKAEAEIEKFNRWHANQSLRDAAEDERERKYAAQREVMRERAAANKAQKRAERNRLRLSRCLRALERLPEISNTALLRGRWGH